jgi:hypothetical protein
MIRTTPWLGILAALLIAAIAAIAAGRDAAAQAGPGSDPHANLRGGEGVGDVPAGPATIRGTVVHSARPEAAGGIEVTLFALGADGRPGKRATQTDATGAFAFEKVSNDPRTVYLLAVQYGEVPFGARTVFRAGQLASNSVIEISDTRADSGDLAAGGVRLRLDRGCDGVRVTETHTLRNPTEFVVQVPAAQRGLGEPIFRIGIPAAASAFTPGRGTLEQALQREGDDVVFWGPVHPGRTDIEFAYSLPGTAETLLLERSFPRGAEKVAVLTWAGGPAPRGEGLRPGAEVSVNGLPYASTESAALAPGQSVAFALDVGAAPPSGATLEIPEVRMWLELDDAALDIREQYKLSVSGGEPLRSESDAPLLCLPLPAGAEDLRLSSEAFSMGIQPDATRGLALRGPIPPGSSSFSMSYLLRSGDDGVRFERAFPVKLSLLTLMIADTGVHTSTDRLHRRRPMRTSDRTYIHLEGFEIEPGETVALDLRSIPPRQPLPRLATVGFVAAAAVATVMLLAAPLRNPRETLAAAATAASVASTADERTAVYASIRDLEEDFATGKVSAEDRAVMLGDLRSRAGALLRDERAAAVALASEAPAAAPQGVAEAASEAAETAAQACPGCGAGIGGDSLFCSQCGAPLAAETAGGAPPG